MHILIGLLTAIATLLFALERLGVDIGWINPWAWRRRRRWMKQLDVNPAFNLESPMEAVALLVLATARVDGDLSSEEKASIRALFEMEFKQSAENASSLLRSVTYLLADGEAVFRQPEKVLEKSFAKFTSDQKASSVEMLERVAAVGGEPSAAQRAFVKKIAVLFQGGGSSEGWQ